jgi:2-polyprenyl-3-methyl-5-hydroxy-6-metoxy-1,4-benzoquinol methylase
MCEIITENKSRHAYWHDDERVWWDTYGNYMNYQWALMPALNKIVRTHWQREFTEFLYCRKGTLLDMGCGSGWLSLYFAKKGMTVLGIDLSDEQVRIANLKKERSGLDNLEFESCNLVYWDCTDYKNKFDSVFVNAFLHHLPADEIKTILKNIAYILRKGGRCYLYEPLASQSKKKSIFAKSTDFAIEHLLAILINKIPKFFNFWSTRYKDELSKGYTMKSPHEAPVDVEWIKKSLPEPLSVANIKAWHLYSLGFAMQIMSLNPPIQSKYIQFARLIYGIDRLLLNMIDWTNFANPGKFILCSVKIEKN